MKPGLGAEKRGTVTLGFLLAACSALAQPIPPPAPVAPIVAEQKVTITIRVIDAKPQGPKQIDPGLADLEKRLAHFNFSQFRLVEEKRFELDLHSDAHMDLPGGRHLVLTPRHMGNPPADKIKIHLELTGPQKEHTHYLHTDYSIQKGATLMVAGPKTEDGTLFIALRHDAK